MKKGFTLIELIIVIAIVAILASIPSPSISGFVKMDRLRISADALVSNLKYAKMYAVGKETIVNVLFEHAEGSSEFDSYWIYNPSSLTGMTLKRVKLPMGVHICAIGDGTTFDTIDRLSFMPEGNVTPYACTIAIKDMDTGARKFITLTIGFTRIMEVEG